MVSNALNDLEQTVDYIDTRLIQVENIIDDILERLEKLDEQKV